MTLADTHADQIAALLNERNQLTRKYTRESVLEHADNYLCRFSDFQKVLSSAR